MNCLDEFTFHKFDFVTNADSHESFKRGLMVFMAVIIKYDTRISIITPQVGVKDWSPGRRE